MIVSPQTPRRAIRSRRACGNPSRLDRRRVPIVWLERASGGVLKRGGPSPFRLTDDDRIRVVLRFLGEKGGVGAAENDHLASTAERIGHAVNVSCVGGIAGDSYEIGRCVETDRLVILIDDRNLVRRANESRQVRHSKLREVIDLPAPKSPDESILGCNQNDAQGS